MDSEIIWEKAITTDMVVGWSQEKISLLVRELDDLVYITYEELANDNNLEGLFDDDFIE